MTEFDVRAALFYSHIDPMSVKRVVYLYDSWSGEGHRVGIVVETSRALPFCYIVHEHNALRFRHSTSTQEFVEEPKHLLDRAEHWITEGPTLAEINKSLGYAKASAKHGSSADSSGHFDTSSVFRF